MTRMGTALAAALFLAIAIPGCRGCKKNQAPPEEEGSIFRDAGMSGPSNLQYGSVGKKVVKVGKDGAEKAYKGCAMMKPITRGDLSTAEGTLWHVFEALLIADPEASFKAFYAHIDSSFQRERAARERWFGTVKKHGPAFQRLIFGPKDPSYMLCATRKEGDGIRLFVGKSPPVGSNPPYSLHKVDGRWLLKTFTPF